MPNVWLGVYPLQLDPAVWPLQSGQVALQARKRYDEGRLRTVNSTGRCNTMTATGGRSVCMKQSPRIYYTAAQKALMWDRWKAGDTLHEIGKLFDRPHISIHTILSATGGIRPPARNRSRLALSMADREEIFRALAAGESIRSVAQRLKRAESTISRELFRNGGGVYATTPFGFESAHSSECCFL